MKTFSEMRREAGAVIKTRWSLRIVLAYALVVSIALAVTVAIACFFNAKGVETWETFNAAQEAAREGGEYYAMPDTRQWWSLTLASAMTSFVQNLFTGIILVGMASVLLRAIRNRDESWFGASFTGFRCPFEMFWLTTLMALRVALWMLLLIVPGIIAMFRYALAWYVKSDHLDWSAGKCLAESGRLMRGHKLQYFGFTIYCLFCFAWWVPLALVLFFVAMDAHQDALLASVPLVCLVMMAYITLSLGLAHTVFYEEVKRIADAPDVVG